MIAEILDPDLPVCMLGEGILWDAERHLLYWVDIDGKKIHRYDPARKGHDSRDMPAQVSFIIPSIKGDLVVGLKDRLARTDFAMSAIGHVSAADMPEGNRFNDGKCDRKGRLWAGTMMLNKHQPKNTGVLYRLDERGLATMETDLVTANGKDWSPDGRTMYHADTGAQTIWAYDYDMGTGAIANKRVLIRFDEKPDGMCMDREGYLYVALFGGGSVAVYSPDGKLHHRIPVPVPNVTCCAFGGEDLATLFITTARDERTPHAGQIFYIKNKTPGFPGARFAF